ncbi:hypothetical protein WP5W18E06_17800 [Klebsiella quasipneumoniae]|nr:hypothetical protein WP5W18E06_17800 [Klebsiella quasipneumoniae]
MTVLDYLLKFRKISSLESLEKLFDHLNYSLTDTEEIVNMYRAADHRRAELVSGGKLFDVGQVPKEVAIKWSAAPDMTPQTVLYRRPVAQFSNFQPKIVSSWLILALFQANFLISGRSRLCPYQLVNSNQVRQGE